MSDNDSRHQSSDFQWVTAEDNWEEEVLAPSAAPSRHPRRRWLPILFVIGVVLMGALLLWRRLLNEAEATTAAVAQDVLATSALVDRAASGQDPDLLLGALSGADDDWTAAQMARTERGLLRENPYFGLVLKETAPLTAADVTVDPDLQRAVLNVPRAFALHSGKGMTETVTLLEPQIYRRGQDRWLLAPPRPADWGEEMTQRYSHLILTYPERDSDTMQRLGPTLNQKAATVCTALGCPGDRRFSIHFGTDPALHLALAESDWVFRTAAPLTLPTPSLVGLPRDEAGFAALQQLYMAQIVNVAMLTDVPCCDHGLFAQAVRDYLLHTLDIRPYPLRAAERHRLLDKPRSPDGYSGAWTASADPLLEKRSWPAVYAIVAFALKGKTPAGILAALHDVRPEMDLDRFFLNAAGHPAGSVINAWYAFLSAPQTATDQDVALVCRREESDDPYRSLLFRMEPLRSRLTLEERFVGDIYASPAQDGRALLLSERRSNRFFERRLLLWRPDGITIVTDPDRGDALASYTRDMDPTERRLVITRPDAPTSAISRRDLVLLDVETCREGSCPLQPLERYPFWSPDGTATLGFEFESESSARVWRGDARGLQGEVLLDNVQWAFWLDDSTVGIVNDRGMFQLGNSGELVQIVALDTLWAELDNDRLLRSTRRNLVMDVIVSPAAPGQLFIHVFDPSQLRHGVLRVGRDRHTVNLEVTSTGQWIELDFSEDGQWLAVAGYDGGRIPQLTLIPVAERGPHREISLPTGDFDWSASGARIVTPLGDNIRVTDLESGTNTVYPIDTTLVCSQTMWLAPANQLGARANSLSTAP